MQIQALLTAATLNLKQLIHRLPVGHSGEAALVAPVSLTLRSMAPSWSLWTGLSRLNVCLQRQTLTFAPIRSLASHQGQG